MVLCVLFFFSSRRRHTRFDCDWSSDVCSSDLTRVLGLRMAAKSVNQDDPTVYHLFYSDERGRAGSDITFFEYPGAAPGRAGAGMVHTVVWRVAAPAALDFWAGRLEAEGLAVERDGDRLRFADP